MKKVCVLGLGYIGLPTALMLSASGIDTAGIDINPDLITKLSHHQITFEEAGLAALFTQAVASGITFHTHCPVAEIYIIAVPTPFDHHTKKIDPSYIIAALEMVLAVAPKNAIAIIESTVSPGTIDRYVRPVAGDLHLVHAPERIIPGRMIQELRENARTIGADSPHIGVIVRELYQSFCQGDIVLTDIRTAEMTKVVENTYRDINIAFANELAKICRADHMSVYEIIRIANMHPRVNILQPGPGVGGHCISVDPWFLVGDYPRLSLLIHEARKINDSMPAFVLKRVQDIVRENNLHRPNIGFYGVTYKEDVDDSRESPTLQLYDLLQLHLGGEAVFYDPMCSGVLPGQVDNFETFVQTSDIIVVMVAHSHIKENMAALRGKLVLDTRNICTMTHCYKL